MSTINHIHYFYRFVTIIYPVFTKLLMKYWFESGGFFYNEISTIIEF